MLKKILARVSRPPDFKVGGEDHPYLLRWWIIPRNRWFNIYLHKFLRDDDDRALHDHPWHSLSITLSGRYYELVHGRAGLFTRYPGSIVFRRARHAHRIELPRDRICAACHIPWRCCTCDTPVPPSTPVPAWTLFITGPRVREWGFLCPQGWRPWQEFTDTRDHGRVGRGCE